MRFDPEVNTLAVLAHGQAKRYPARPAVTVDERTLSYSELWQRSECRAAELWAQGIGLGARVGVLSKESLDVVELLLAIARCGAVSVPINWRSSPAEVAHVADDADCELLYASHDLLPATSLVPPGCAVRELGPLVAGAARASKHDEFPLVRPDDTAVQLYTSGTTGKPKGVELPHDSFFALARELDQRGQRWMGWSEHDVSLGVLPLFHVGGLWWLVRGLASGAHNVLLPQFVGWRAIEAIERHRVTKAAMVPAMIQIMLAEPDAEPQRFASLRTLGYGGSPIPPGLVEQVRKTIGCELFQAYGLTETGNIAVCLWPEDHAMPDKRTAAGRPMPGVSVKVVGLDGRELPTGQIGEVCLRSPAAMRGYWRAASATADTLRDGWVHTGDAGWLDADGYLYISDRIKDMVCCAGEKVWPAEVESVLAEHPAVRELAIVGIPHAEWGEVVRAVAVLRPGHQLDLQELRAFGRARLAEFKLPTSLQLVDGLPRTPAGKVQKRALRAAVTEARPL